MIIRLLMFLVTYILIPLGIWMLIWPTVKSLAQHFLGPWFKKQIGRFNLKKHHEDLCVFCNKTVDHSVDFHFTAGWSHRDCFNNTNKGAVDEEVSRCSDVRDGRNGVHAR